MHSPESGDRHQALIAQEQELRDKITLLEAKKITGEELNKLHQEYEEVQDQLREYEHTNLDQAA